MNKKTLLSLSIALLGFASVATASLTNANWYSLDYNKLNCNTTWNGGTETLGMSASQYASGVMKGTFYADTAEDPNALKIYSIVNDTGSNWFGYNINVYLDHNFSISNILVSLPADWFIYSVTQPTNNSGSALYFPGSEYLGHIILSAGTPIPDTGELDFRYNVGFAGATSYRFADELSPIFAPIPEPTLLGFGALAGLALVMRARRKV